MTLKQFKIWLITNNIDRNSLCKDLGITSRTLQNYISNERFPKIFVLALKGIEKTTEEEADYAS